MNLLTTTITNPFRLLRRSTTPPAEYRVPATVTDDPDLPRVTLGGVTFHAETFGDPTHPVVIVLHGGPGGDYRYLLNLKALADEFFVVFYDQRGSGLSERLPVEAHGVQANIDDIDLFVDHFSPSRPVHIIGHSWGGMIGAGYAGQHPEKVARLVVAEPGALTVANVERLLKLQRSVITPSYIWHAFVAGLKGMFVNGPDADARKDYIVGTSAHRWVEHPNNPYNCAGTYESAYWRWGTTAFSTTLNERDADGQRTLAPIEDYVSQFPGPVLVLASACNTWIGADFQREQMRLFANAQLVEIHTAGHEMFTQSPEESIPPVRAFLLA